MRSKNRLTLRSARMMRGITQAKMAELLGIHLNTYVNWEQKPDNISIRNAEKICSILEMQTDDIIFLEK